MFASVPIIKSPCVMSKVTYCIIWARLLGHTVEGKQANLFGSNGGELAGRFL